MQALAILLGFAVEILKEAVRFAGALGSPRNLYGHKLLLRDFSPLLIQPIPLVTTFAISLGGVLAIETLTLLDTVALEEPLIELIANAVVSHLAPLLIGVFVSARAGLKLAVKIGSRVEERGIDAIILMDINAIHFFVAPYFWLFMISVLLLDAWCTGVSLFVSSLMFKIDGIVPFYVFWEIVWDSIGPIEIIANLAKCLLAGFFVMVISAYNGFALRDRLRDISDLAVQTVVHAVLIVILVELFVTIATI